jgi:hypothetical protein
MSGGIGHPHNDEIIIVGDKIDLVTYQGIVYRSMIEDRLSTGQFLVGIPNRKGVFMSAGEGDDVYLVFYRESGRYIAQMRVIAFENRNGIRYMWLEQMTVAQKNQRRAAFRLPIEFEVEISEELEDHEKSQQTAPKKPQIVSLETVMSRDLSVTGVALLTKKQYELGSEYLLELHFDKTAARARTRSIHDKSSNTMRMTGAVKRCIPWRATKLFNTGMHFMSMTESMSDNLAKYVLNEQQKQIKRRRMLI